MQAPAPPAPPQPAVAGTPAPATATPQVAQTAPARPLTPAEVASIRARRSELSSQLTSAAGRRDELAQQLEDAQGQNRVGLEQRLAVLDNRIVQLERDIAETGRQLTAPQYTSSSVPATMLGMSPQQTTAVSIVFTLFVLAPIALAVARSIWRRAVRGGPMPDSAEVTRRLISLEQSIDAIAVEVERVSEGQRYVTKIFSDGRVNGALPAGQAPAEPIRIDQGDRVAVPRDER